MSNHNHGQFVPVNCGAIPHELAESELFGHEKGAFTGASKEKVGKFETANGGSILLDEIGEMSLFVQTKLLRVVEEKTVTRVGSNKCILLNSRVITSTNMSLWQMVEEGTFRKDLYYRLSEFSIYLPPLRNRKEDIHILSEHFLQQARNRFSKEGVKSITPDAMKLLMEYDYPGNVRELKNMINRAVITTDNEYITAEDLFLSNTNGDSEKVLKSSMKNGIATVEKLTIMNALKTCKGNKRKTAQELGIGEATLYRKLKRFGLSKDKSLLV